MNSQHLSPSKFVVLVGTLWLVCFTLFPPRCTISHTGDVTREKSAPLYSDSFHSVERAVPRNGATRQYTDAAGKIWQTTSDYDPAQLDWTRYTLGSVLIVALTCSTAFLASPSAAKSDLGRPEQSGGSTSAVPNASP